MSLKNFLLTHCYRRRSLLDPTHNYARLPATLIKSSRHLTVLDVGAGAAKLSDHVITLDLFSPADIKGDAHTLPIKSKSIDLVFCIAVLEHTQEPYQVVTELIRILKPGGRAYIEIPFLQPFHSSPHDYYRATLPGLRHWCRQLKHLESGVCVGPGSTIAWIIIEYTRLWVAHIPFIGVLIELAVRAILLPLKLFDRFLVRHPDSHITASAIYFYGQKPSTKPSRPQKHS